MNLGTETVSAQALYFSNLVMPGKLMFNTPFYRKWCSLPVDWHAGDSYNPVVAPTLPEPLSLHEVKLC